MDLSRWLLYFNSYVIESIVITYQHEMRLMKTTDKSQKGKYLPLLFCSLASQEKRCTPWSSYRKECGSVLPVKSSPSLHGVHPFSCDTREPELCPASRIKLASLKSGFTVPGWPDMTCERGDSLYKKQQETNSPLAGIAPREAHQ